MDDRESPFIRTQASRSLIRPHGVRKILLSPAEYARQLVHRQQQQQPRSPETMTPNTPNKRLPASHHHAPVESLKQWELVEDDKGLQVVEKRKGGGPLTPVWSKEIPTSTGFYKRRVPVAAPRRPVEKSIDTTGLDQSKIVQPIGLSPQQQTRESATTEPKMPLSLDLILKQRTTSAESTDMLQILEQQVKNIEMNTIAARTRQTENNNSSDFGPEIQLRYREHEDLLRNATDDEAEG